MPGVPQKSGVTLGRATGAHITVPVAARIPTGAVRQKGPDMCLWFSAIQAENHKQYIVRQCPTLPPDPSGSTISVVRLNDRVRNGTGCFPYAITTETSTGHTTLNMPHTQPSQVSSTPPSRVVEGSHIVDTNTQKNCFDQQEVVV